MPRTSLYGWVALVALIGTLVTAGAFYGGAHVVTLVRAPAQAQEPLAAVAALPKPAAQAIALGTVGEDSYTPPAEGRALYVNLPARSILLYEDGVERERIPIISIGKEGTPWQTPAGSYRIQTKEEAHFSSIGRVWMPYSLQFFGNYFIHGVPYYPNGTLVASSYSGGCIRLATADAKRVFEFVSLGTPVSITAEGERGAGAELDEPSFYFLTRNAKLPRISAQSYLVADLETGEVLMERDATRRYPIASVTKLMTALTSLNVVNQYASLKVSKAAVETHGDYGNLVANEPMTAGDLLYPLLLESSNDAAEALARFHGRERFLKSMNEQAAAIHLGDTYFADPSGLSPSNVSTARDLFTLARYLYAHKPYVLELTRTPLKRLKPALPGAREHTWYNNNYFVRKGDPYYFGGKNGFTDEANRTLLSTFSLPLAEFEKRHIAIVILQSENREEDAERLLSYLTKNIYYGTSPDVSRLALAPLQQKAASAAASVAAAQRATPALQELVATLTTGLAKKGSGAGGSASLSFVGDIMLDRGVRERVQRNFSGDYARVFELATFLSESDLSFGNLEGPVSDRGKKAGSIYSFRMDPLVVPALKQAGFDVLSLANNHAGDWGREALADTVVRLRAAGLTPVGAGDSRVELQEPVVRMVNGNRIGFLALSDVGPSWLTAGTSTSGILTVSNDFSTIIARAAAQVDVLVVSLHWGEEYRAANARQRQLAHAAVDAGADLIIGHHPHVAQETEVYRGAFIAYSLGNFVFDQSFSQETMEGLALTVHINRGAVVGITKHALVLNNDYQPRIAYP